MSFSVIDGGVTAALGFKAGGVNAGIKNQVKKDMAMVVSDAPCVVAGTFTTNRVCAAPVIWDKQLVQNSEYVQAVVVNTGIANACTGQEGLDACKKISETAAQVLSLPSEAILVCSTGVIGMQLPMDKIAAGIKALPGALGYSREDATTASKAIMTTDTVCKEVAVKVTIGGREVSIGGMCKGSGMIHPNMATMLCFITTDVNISKELLTKAVKLIVPDTFNMISVDGDTSTNDTVLVLANAMAGNVKIETENDDYKEFYDALFYVLCELSKKIAGDGEGATCLFEANVAGAATKEQAKILAKSIITSNLTKAAIFGHDANWGRILCAMGYSGADFEPEKVSIFFESSAGKLQIVENGIATDYSEEKATQILSCNPVKCIAELGMGQESATAWGCDLTFDYVKINADYRS